MWITRTETYERITLTGFKRVSCSVCGKRLARQLTVGQTLSPFNKDETGQLKTVDQINDELRKDIVQWKTEQETCRSCQNKE